MVLQERNRACNSVSFWEYIQATMLTSLKGANETSPSCELYSSITFVLTNDFLRTEVSLNTATLLEKSECSEDRRRGPISVP